MKLFYIRLTLFILFSFLFLEANMACDKNANFSISEVSFENMVGEKISEVIHVMHLKLGNNFVIEEPPGIGRGIRGTIKNGDEVWLYVGKRISNNNKKWSLDIFEQEEVKGIAVKKDGKWIFVKGQVIYMYHVNTN